MTDVRKVFTVHEHWETFWWGMYLFGEGLKNRDVTGLGNRSELLRLTIRTLLTKQKQF